MILWQDFILDDQFGPYIVTDDSTVVITSRDIKCRKAVLGSPNVMEDVRGQIQETGQEKRPARMVGYSSLDSISQSGTDASLGDRVMSSRRRGEA